MKERSRKNILIYLSTMLILLSFMCNKGKKHETSTSYETEETYELYTSYKNGNVYFCDSVSVVEEVYDVCDERDVVIVDQSDLDDPDMKIMSSYKITDYEEMREILEIIKQYCSEKPSSWNRSIESMQNEWIIHNICSSLSIRKSRTDDVDLNNQDEFIYNSKIITKILGN